MKFFKYIFLLFILFFIILYFKPISSKKDYIQLNQSVPKINLKSLEENFKEGLKIKTISDKSFYNQNEFDRFDNLLKEKYQNLYKLNLLTKINQSYVFKIKGKNSSNPVLFYAHYDVVPVTEKDWSSDPFAALTDKEGFIVGRGAFDDKASVFSLLEVFNYFLENQIIPENDLYLALGEDEEVGGLKGAKKIADYFKKENIFFEWTLDEGGFVLEGDNLKIKNQVAFVGTGERGYLDLKITLKGEAGHSSFPPKENVIEKMAKLIGFLKKEQKINNLPFSFKQMIEYSLPSMSTDYQFLFNNFWLFEPLLIYIFDQDNKLRATINSSMTTTIINGGLKSNILPSEVSVVINCRLLPGITDEYIKKMILDAYKKAKISESINLEVINYNPASTNIVPDQKSWNLIASAIKTIDSNVEPIPYLSLGGTDSTHFSEIAKNNYRFLFIRTLKDRLKGMHGVDEKISIKELEELYQFYYLLMINL